VGGARGRGLEFHKCRAHSCGNAKNELARLVKSETVSTTGLTNGRLKHKPHRNSRTWVWPNWTAPGRVSHPTRWR